jgi:MYXO-CTERM domain-containing protein
VTCPEDFVCRLDSCVHRSAVEGPRFSAGGAGGCDCRMGDAPGAGWPALVLLLVLRRRP